MSKVRDSETDSETDSSILDNVIFWLCTVFYGCVGEARAADVGRGTRSR